MDSNLQPLEKDIVLIYQTIKQLKMRKELPAYITWAGNDIYMIVNDTMLYHIKLEAMLNSIASCTWQELDGYMSNGNNFNLLLEPDRTVLKLFNKYNEAVMYTNPFYTSNTLKEDIKEMGLKAADGMRKLRINPNCFLSIFNGISADNAKDSLLLYLYKPNDIFWEGTFVVRFNIIKKKGHFSYDQFFNSLLV